MPVPDWVVDMLPRRLWKPGNLFMPFRHDLHFCSALDAGRPVRTIEWDAREVGRGRQRFQDPPEEPSWLWRVIVPRVVDGLPSRLWTPPGRAWLGGRVIFELDEGDGPEDTARAIDVFGRPGLFMGRPR
jgi:hypothetical protein